MTKKTYNIRTPLEWDNLITWIDKKITSTIAFKGFSVTFDKIQDKRSLGQLRLYWVIINRIKEFMNSYGNDMTGDEVSDMMKDMFFSRTIILPSGEERRVRRSISDGAKIDTSAMSEFQNKVLAWAAQNGLDIKELGEDNGQVGKRNTDNGFEN